jgi:hypothetical protein
MSESVKRQLRQFTGNVSAQAVVATGGDLRLEHYKRIQTTLTALVTRHRTQVDEDEFVRMLIEYERVHIVTTKENYDAMRAKGDYGQAGIVLVPWAEIPLERRSELWRKMLRGRVANADAYAPQSAPEA